MKRIFRPLLRCDAKRPSKAVTLAAGWTWFDRLEVLNRNGSREVVSVDDLSLAERNAFTAPRCAIAGLGFDAPSIMGILNATPDSFSDGGVYNQWNTAVTRALEMQNQGAAIIDIGGESTRPGAAYVEPKDEIARTAPVIQELRAASSVPISIDTRKAPVGQAALDAGATLVNDVYAFTHDPDLLDVAVQTRTPVCIMHAQGDPKMMQNDPHYDNVVLDVYQFLSDRIAHVEAAGIPRDQIIVDPGIGFGKTLEHNLALLRDIAVFHGLGVPVLLGASRKRFIGVISGEENAAERVAGTVAVTLNAIAQGVQIHRVHDIAQAKQAIDVWMVITGQSYE